MVPVPKLIRQSNESERCDTKGYVLMNFASRPTTLPKVVWLDFIQAIYAVLRECYQYLQSRPHYFV
jgi:hypothetical protein